MTSVLLLPRLNELGVEKIIDAAKGRIPSVDVAIQTLEEHSSFLWFAPSGGSPSHETVMEIAQDVRQIARKFGFPAASDQKARSAFDTEVAIHLGSLGALSSGEALRDDVWAFLSSVLLADVVAWRFPDRNRERFRGGVRNAFQRLWIRGITLDLGENAAERWRLVEALSEDAMVQIFERASLSSDRKLARAIAAAWLETSLLIGRGRMEIVMRTATKLLRLRNEIVDLGYLEDLVLKREMEGIFFRAAGVNDEVRSKRALASAGP